MKVALREVEPSDAPWLDAWLGACAASVGYDIIDPHAPAASLAAAAEGGLRARIIAEAQPAGIVTYRIQRAAAVIEFVGVQPEHARRGLGHAGASAAEDELRAGGASVIYAPAPALHGIDVYFWIRLGYRPLPRAEWPCDRPGVAWLARALAPTETGSSSRSSRRR